MIDEPQECHSEISSPNVIANIGCGPEKKEIIKTGIHLIFPNLKSTIEQARKIRLYVIVELQRQFGSPPASFEPWEQQLDAAVYKDHGAGLRMPGSTKAIACLKCFADVKNAADKATIIQKEAKDRGDKTFKAICEHVECKFCNNRRKLMEVRKYFAHFYLDATKLIDNPNSTAEELNNRRIVRDLKVIRNVVRTCTIRISQLQQKIPNAVIFEVPKHVPVDVRESQEYQERMKSRKRKDKDVLTEDQVGLKHLKVDAEKDLVVDSKKLAMVEQLVRRASKIHFVEFVDDIRAVDIYPKQVFACYQNVGVKTKVRKLRHYYVTIYGYGQHCCGNLIRGHSHSGNTHYWMVQSNGITQRCFCRCQKLEHRRSNLLCQNYTSTKYDLNEEEKQTLFGITIFDFQSNMQMNLARSSNVIGYYPQSKKEQEEIRNEREFIPQITAERLLKNTNIQIIINDHDGKPYNIGPHMTKVIYDVKFASENREKRRKIEIEHDNNNNRNHKYTGKIPADQD